MVATGAVPPVPATRGGVMTSVLPDREVRGYEPPSHRASLDPRALLANLVVGAAFVVLLWWHDTPPTIHTFGDWLTNAGRVTGLLAGYVIVVLLLLMARVPAL